MITALYEANQDGAHDVVIDTPLNDLVKSSRTKLMDKFSVGWVWHQDMAVEKDSTMSQTIYGHTTSWCGKKAAAWIRCWLPPPTQLKWRKKFGTGQRTPSTYELVQMLQGTLNGYDLNPSDIDFIHIVHGGDHGKNKFCFALKLVLCDKAGKSYSRVFGLADMQR